MQQLDETPVRAKKKKKKKKKKRDKKGTTRPLVID